MKAKNSRKREPSDDIQGQEISKTIASENLETFSGMLTKLNPIRVETVMSKFPLHKITPNEPDEITVTDPNNQEVRWRVINRPGIAAYKFHTLIVNREIERTGRPIPALLPLGSLRKIAEELGLGRNTNFVKSIIEQNAWAVIAPRITYLAQNGKRKFLEKQFSICKAVYFSGDVLPTGEQSTQVVLEFNDEYLSLLNNARTRPLDYDYLKILTPKEQRWYELVSYSIYSALQRNEAYAVIKYSDFCLYAPQNRFFTAKEIYNQMNEIHKTHIKTSYLEKAEMKKIRNLLEADWELRYYPGLKARQEFAEAAKGHNNSVLESNLLLSKENTDNQPAEVETIEVKIKKEKNPNSDNQYYNTLLQLKINEKTAKNLIITDLEEVKYQLSIFDKDRKYNQSPAAYLVWAIKNKFRPANAVFSEDVPTQNALFENDTPPLDPGKPRKFTDEPCPVCYGGKMQVVKGKGARVCTFCQDEKNRPTGKFPIEYDEYFLDQLLNSNEYSS